MIIPIPLMQLLSIVFFISAPLCFVAFILSVVGLAKGQIGRGIALLISTLILPVIFALIGIFIVPMASGVSSTGRELTIWRGNDATAPTILAAPKAPTVAAGVAQNIAGTVPMFCRDSTGAYQPLQRTDYGRLQRAFTEQFGARSSLQATSDSMGILTFSEDGDPNAAERIYYDVEVRNGGLALLRMHVRLTGISESLSGNEMCGKTFSILHAGPAATSVERGICVDELSKSEREQAFLNPPTTHVVLGDGRLYFHTAPHEDCRLKDIFVVPGDDLVVYTEYRGWFSVMYLSPKTQGEFSGWVKADRLKATGTVRPKS